MSTNLHKEIHYRKITVVIMVYVNPTNLLRTLLNNFSSHIKFENYCIKNYVIRYLTNKMWNSP